MKQKNDGIVLKNVAATVIVSRNDSIDLSSTDEILLNSAPMAILLKPDTLHSKHATVDIETLYDLSSCNTLSLKFKLAEEAI